MSTLTLEQLAAVEAFARANGRCWKTKLCAAWASGVYLIPAGRTADDSSLLQQVRNQHGPRWLMKYRAAA